MAKILIGADDTFQAVASDDDPDWKTIQKHPYYKHATEILHTEGLRPKGVRGYPRLMELLNNYDGTHDKKALVNTDSKAMQIMKRDLATGLEKLKVARARIAKMPDSADEAAHDDAAREVRNAQQYVDGLRLSISRMKKH